MIIQVQSLGEIATLAAGVSGLVITVSTLHWKAFLAPRLEKIFKPHKDRLEIVTSVVQDKFPVEYRAAEQAVQRNNELRAAI